MRSRSTPDFHFSLFQVTQLDATHVRKSVNDVMTTPITMTITNTANHVRLQMPLPFHFVTWIQSTNCISSILACNACYLSRGMFEYGRNISIYGCFCDVIEKNQIPYDGYCETRVRINGFGNHTRCICNAFNWCNYRFT